MSAWTRYKVTEVLGDTASGAFTATPTEHVQKENQSLLEQAQEVEGDARSFRGLVWPGELLPPDFAVIRDGLGSLRVELCLFIRRGRELKDVRLHGPRRHTREEARKDGCVLKRVAFNAADSLDSVLVQLATLEGTEWSASDLSGDDMLEGVERCLPELTLATPAEQFKEHQNSFRTLKSWIYEKTEMMEHTFAPAGPGWTVARSTIAVPRLPGIWYVHERQQADGKHAPWLYFNASTGKYYRQLVAEGSSNGWIQMGQPHLAVDHAVAVLHGATCLPARCGRKDDLTVSLPELVRTGSMLRQPLMFLDKPAALFLLVDGMRDSDGASKFCAQRFHTHFMPLLRGRITELEDHELKTMVTDAVHFLDVQLLESGARYAGCGLAILLVLGKRVLVATVGGTRIVRCKLQGDGRPHVELLSGVPVTVPLTAALSAARQTLIPPDCSNLVASSICGEKFARVLERVLRARHPFAVVGLQPTDISTTSIREAVRAFESSLCQSSKDVGNGALQAALFRVKESALIRDMSKGWSPCRVLQQLIRSVSTVTMPVNTV